MAGTNARISLSPSHTPKWNMRIYDVEMEPTHITYAHTSSALNSISQRNYISNARTGARINSVHIG